MSWPSSGALADLVIAAHDEARAATDPALARLWRSIGDRLSEVQREIMSATTPLVARPPVVHRRPLGGRS
jgi:hypothetical protein